MPPRLLKLNTEDFPAVAERFGIRSVPTMLFSKGAKAARISGVMDSTNRCDGCDHIFDNMNSVTSATVS